MKYKFAVLGNPIAHSISPQIHSLFAKQFNLNISYEKILVPRESFSKVLKNFLINEGYGANVTLPFKEKAFQISTALTDRALKAKSVNTLTRLDEQNWLGDNTDGIGLVKDILYQQIDLQNKKILIIGAGGASRGIIYPLLQENTQSITVTNRTLSKAELLAHEFDIEYSPIETAHQKSYDIIINATSSGLTGEHIKINPAIFKKCIYVYDMVYKKEDTLFMLWAKENDVQQISNGLGMLVYQAAESFFQWTKLMPACHSVIKQLAC